MTAQYSLVNSFGSKSFSLGSDGSESYGSQSCDILSFIRMCLMFIDF